MITDDPLLLPAGSECEAEDINGHPATLLVRTSASGAMSLSYMSYE
jgi:hypothetical protein